MAPNRNRLKRKPQKATTTTQQLNGQTRTIATTTSGRKADVSRHPATGLYRPIPHIWFQHPVDLPPFTFTTVRAMLMDEGIRLNFATRAAPLYGLEFGWEENGQWQEGVKCRDAAVAQFIYRQIQRIWKTFLPDILRAQIWGWSAGEVTLKLSEETGLLEINEMLSRHPMDCRLLKIGCERWGIQVNRVDSGPVNLPFPYAWFHAYGAEDGEDYGTSAAYGAYSAWADKWFDGGAKEVRRLFMHKDAYGGVDLGYPDGETFIQGYDNPIPNRDIARQIAESIRSGGVTTRPSERDESGNEKWPLTRATVASNPQHILQYPKDLDEEIRHGMEICDDVINSGTTGSWDGKSIPMQSFYSGIDGWAIKILRDLCVQIIDPLILLNYGKKHEYETPFKPLAKQAMERQNQTEKQDAGKPQDSPNNPQFASEAYQPHEQTQQPLTLSLDERVGTGEIGVSDILKASRRALDKLSGGNADYLEDEDFPADQLEAGIEEEMEHTDDPEIAKEIAKDHLTEDPNAYTESERLITRIARFFTRLLSGGPVQRMSAEKSGERWITIGGDKGNGEGGGFPVKIDKDGKMLTGKFAGSTLKEAFEKGGKADKKNDRDRDTAVVNVPLSKRGDLDKQIDRHKAEQEASTKAKRKSDAAIAKSAKSEAKDLFEKYGDEIAKSTALKHGVDAKEAKKTLEYMVKWEPEKALQMLKSHKAKKEQAIKQLNGVPYPERFSDSDKFVAGRFAGAIANTDGGNSQQAAMEAINYAAPGYIESELRKPVSFVSQRIARVAANAMDPDQKYTKSLLKEWADLHDQLPLSDQGRNAPSSEVFKKIDEQRPLVLDALRLNGFINEPTAAEEEDQKTK